MERSGPMDRALLESGFGSVIKPVSSQELPSLAESTPAVPGAGRAAP